MPWLGNVYSIGGRPSCADAAVANASNAPGRSGAAAHVYFRFVFMLEAPVCGTHRARGPDA